MRSFTLLSVFLFVFLTGWSQNALKFDGTGDYIQTNYKGILGNNPITVEAWVNVSLPAENVITAWGAELSGGNRFTFRIDLTVLRVENKGGFLKGTTTITDGKWHHVAVTYDPNATDKYKLYVDGVLDVKGNIPTPLNVVADVNMRIGRRIHPTYTGYFNGTMDELRVWDVARTQKELYDNKDVELSTLPSRLVAYYQFNQGVAGGSNSTETTLYDKTSNSYNGSLLTFALSGSNSNWVNGMLFSGVRTTDQKISICDGESITVGNNTYSVSGVYKDTLTSSIGCDSAITTDLTISPSYSESNSYNECQGFSITVGSNTYTETGLYYDTLETVGGCDSVILTYLNINEVDTSVTVDAALLTAANSYSYQWLDCDDNYSPISGAVYKAFRATETGNYAVEVVQNGCKDTSACYYVNLDGIEDIGEDVFFAIYPNPNAGKFTINTNIISKNCTLDILSLDGKIVVRRDLTGQNLINLSIEFEELNAGVYFVQLNTEDMSYTTKLIIK